MDITYKTPAIYSRDSKGLVRVWQSEVATTTNNSYWRTISGIHEGNMVISEWREALPKNIGKKNETTAEEQAIFEANAAKVKKEGQGYFENISDIDTFTKFSPMLAQDYAKLKKELPYPVYSQPKLDGIRCIARTDGLWTRAGKEIIAVPHVFDALKEFFDENPDVILDGELYNHELRDDFNTITSVVRKTKPNQDDIEQAKSLVEYHIYDVVDTDMMETTFDKRIARVQEIFNEVDSASIKFVETRSVETKEELDNLYGSYLEDGFEGQMVRLPEFDYETKRSRSLLKRKDFFSNEFEVLAVEEGAGNWSGHIKRFILKNKDGKSFGAGVRGNQAQLKALFEKNEAPKWATLRYFTPSEYGVPRFPVVIDYGFEDARTD